MKGRAAALVRGAGGAGSDTSNLAKLRISGRLMK